MRSIGILLPRSTFYAGIGFDIFESFRASLKLLGRNDIQIVTENIGFGAEKQECYRAAERLLLHENVPIVFAYIGQRTAQLLRPLFMAANRLLVVLDAGSHLPHEWPTSPNIFYHSLHNSLGAWLSAERALRDGYRIAGMVSGFYDGGYLQTYALTKGFQKEGAEIVFNHATGHKREEFSLQVLKSHIEIHPDACLLALFSGDFVQWFLEELTAVFPERSVPVYVAPFSFEESMLETTRFRNYEIRGVAAWMRDLSTRENKIFVNAMQDLGRRPNLFALLGWEAAIICFEVLRLMDMNLNDSKALALGLRSFSFVGPRGNCFFHEATQNSISPLFEVAMVDNGQGYCGLSLQGTIADTEETFEAMIAQPLDKAVSGWYNSYACI